MRNPARWLWDKVGGNALWDAITGIGKWAWGVGMISSALALTLGWLQSLPWVLLYLYALYALLFVLMVANELQRKRIQKKVEQGELLLPFHNKAIESAQQTIFNLEKELAATKEKLAAFEDKRPLLKVEPFYTERTPQHNLNSGRNRFWDRVGSFVFLRVTNEPENLNSQSFAYRIYARITYCDAQWKPLFYAVDGLWFDFAFDYDPKKIGFPKRTPESIAPHKSLYLGIALKYKWGGTPLHPLCAESRGHPDWLNPELTLPRETTYIKIILGCDGFRDVCYLLLKNDGAEEGLLLEPTTPPTLSPEDKAHFS